MQSCAFEIRESTLPGAGNGLFALAPLTAGEPCCFYDGRDFQRSDRSADADAARDSAYVLEHPSEPAFRAGFATPRVACGVAQMANDAGITPSILATLASSRSVPSTLAAVHEYESRAHATATIRQNTSSGAPSAWEFYATANVSTGAEVFFSYSASYWTKMQMESSETDPVARLALCLARGEHERRRGLPRTPCLVVERAATGERIEFIGEDGGALMQRASADATPAPLTDELAGAFVIKLMRPLRLDSPLWRRVRAEGGGGFRHRLGALARLLSPARDAGRGTGGHARATVAVRPHVQSLSGARRAPALPPGARSSRTCRRRACAGITATVTATDSLSGTRRGRRPRAGGAAATTLLINASDVRSSTYQLPYILRSP